MQFPEQSLRKEGTDKTPTPFDPLPNDLQLRILDSSESSHLNFSFFSKARTGSILLNWTPVLPWMKRIFYIQDKIPTLIISNQLPFSTSSWRVNIQTTTRAQKAEVSKRPTNSKRSPSNIGLKKSRKTSITASTTEVNPNKVRWLLENFEFEFHWVKSTQFHTDLR